MRALGLPLAIVAAAGRCAAVSECEFHVGMDIQVPAGLPGAGTELKVQKAGTLQAGLQNRFQNRFSRIRTPQEPILEPRFHNPFSAPGKE